MPKTKVYDLCKILLTLLVVFAHASRMYNGGVYTPIHESSSLRLLTIMIYTFHMPAFFMLSGCIFGYQIDSGKYRDHKAFLVGKARSLLVPYLIVGILMVAPTMVGLGLTEDSFLHYVCDGIFLGNNNRHLWYILALFWMFALTIPLRKLLLSRKLWCAIVILLGGLLLSYFNPLRGILQGWDTANYFLFFLIGIYLNRYWENIFTRKNRLWIALAALVCLMVLAMRVFNINRVLYYVFALAGSIAMLCIVSLLPEAIGNWKLSRQILMDSYGIYLFHPMLIYIFFALTWYRDIHPWILCCGAAVLSVVISMLLSAAVRKLHLGLVLGERKRQA